MIISSFIVSSFKFISDKESHYFFFFKYSDRSFSSKLQLDKIIKMWNWNYYLNTMKTFFFDVFKSCLMLYICFKHLMQSIYIYIFHNLHVSIGSNPICINCLTTTSNDLIILMKKNSSFLRLILNIFVTFIQIL